jgi:hypothetical protein
MSSAFPPHFISCVRIAKFTKQELPDHPLYDDMDDLVDDEATDSCQQQTDRVRHYSSTCLGTADGGGGIANTRKVPVAAGL